MVEAVQIDMDREAVMMSAWIDVFFLLLVDQTGIIFQQIHWLWQTTHNFIIVKLCLHHRTNTRWHTLVPTYETTHTHQLACAHRETHTNTHTHTHTETQKHTHGTWVVTGMYNNGIQQIRSFFIKSFLRVGNLGQFNCLKFNWKKMYQFFISYTKIFLDFEREPSQFLKFLAWRV